MSYKISDIPVHNAAPVGTSKMEIENPTGPTSEWATIAEILAANDPSRFAARLYLHAALGGL